jgi:membrane protein YdbS with pleckstrin-like domain
MHVIKGEMMITISEKAYPSLYQATDKASISSQKKFYFYLRIYLIMLIVAAFVSYQWPDSQSGAIVSASLFFVTLLLLVVIKLEKPDEKWYNSRAAAESVKTIVWKWMMHAKPYQNQENEHNIIRDLKEILLQNKDLSSVFNEGNDLKFAVTKEMQTVRDMSFEERKSLYLLQRIEEQQKWYAIKSKKHKLKAQRWFWIAIIFHAIAIILLVLRIKAYHYQFPIEVIATSASSILAWLQANKFNELSVAYTLTAHEIAFIIADAKLVTTDESLSNFVVYSENAFSREHTQWYARKGEY